MIITTEVSQGKFWEQVIIPNANLNDGFLFFNAKNSFLQEYGDDRNHNKQIFTLCIQNNENTIIIFPDSQSETEIIENGIILIMNSSGGC